MTRDWSATPLGTRERWPEPLRWAVDLVLAHRFPMLLAWGPDRIAVFNDAFLDLVGESHACDFGRPVGDREPIVSTVMSRGETIYREEAEVDACYSPVRGVDGAVGGVLVTLRERSTGSAERQYRTLAENSPEVIARFDRQLRHTYVNRYGARVYGVPQDEVIGRTNAELGMPPDKVAFWKDHFDAVFASGEQRTVDFEFDSPTFGRQYFSSLFVPERGAGGAVESILAITRDVTPVRRAEQELRAERDFVTAVLDTAAFLVLVLNRDGTIVRFNRACELASGYTLDEVIGRSYEMLLPPEEVPAVRATIARTAAGEPPIHGENHWLARDGTLRLIAWTNTIITGADGTPRFVVATGIDITERRSAEEGLRASEAKFRSVFEQSAIGMGRVRFEDARWVDVNAAFCRMAGRTREEMLKTPWPEITHPADIDLDLVPFRRMAAGELDSYTVEKRFIHGDGHHVWARLTLSLVRDANDRPEYEIAIIEDVTQRKQAEAALVQANQKLVDEDRRKNEFLGMLSHELRNPMAPIFNSLFILEHTEPGGEKAHHAREVLSRQVGQMSRLIDDLLDVTRIARGKIQLRTKDVDLAQVLHRLCDDYRTLMEERQLELACPQVAPLSVRGDETRIAQVVGNLLQNAAKFTPPGGRIAMSAGAEDGHAVIRVRDTGVGIEPGLLPQIFEPFTQAKQSLARTEGGLGLGLALVKGLVELHGGTVSAANVPEGGAEFTVRLPLVRRQAPERSPQIEKVPPPERHRVLVVDDNVDAAESLGTILALMGHEVEVARDGFEAIEKLDAHRFDVVLCDIGLPGIDGYEVARRVRARGQRVRLVAVSGYAQPEDLERSAAAGFDAHVAKPAGPDRIREVLA